MAENTNTETAQYNVMGENTLTGNTWHCEGPLPLADAQDMRRGYARLEGDYKIAYYVEKVTG